jgi:hypothetical protein
MTIISNLRCEIPFPASAPSPVTVSSDPPDDAGFSSCFSITSDEIVSSAVIAIFFGEVDRAIDCAGPPARIARHFLGKIAATVLLPWVDIAPCNDVTDAGG